MVINGEFLYVSMIVNRSLTTTFSEVKKYKLLNHIRYDSDHIKAENV
jgi:hypothetical protein